MASSNSISDTTDEKPVEEDHAQRKPSTEQRNTEEDKMPTNAIPEPHRSFGFWMIMVALCITGLLAAFENTVVATSLPTIVTDLEVGGNYVWITNAFFLTR